MTVINRTYLDNIAAYNENQALLQEFKTYYKLLKNYQQLHKILIAISSFNIYANSTTYQNFRLIFYTRISVRKSKE